MDKEFVEQITGLVPQKVRDEQPERWQEVLKGWGVYFYDYNIPMGKQREEFDAILRMRMAHLVMSVAPPTDEEKSKDIVSELLR